MSESRTLGTLIETLPMFGEKPTVRALREERALSAGLTPNWRTGQDGWYTAWPKRASTATAVA